MPIRLVACDLDLTLLDSKQQIAPEVRQAIRSAVAAGVHVVVASGRNRVALLPWIERLGLEPPFIGLGGGLVVGPGSSGPIGHWPMTFEDAARIAKAARAESLLILYEEMDNLLLEGTPEAVEAQRLMIGLNVPHVADVLRSAANPPTKVVLIGGNEQLERTARSLDGPGSRLYLARSRPTLLDVTAAGVHKGSALRLLADHLGLDLSQVAALGDSFNDLTMFEAAGLAIAMGNASPAVKAEADVIAPSCDEAGAAWALERIASGELTGRPAGA